MRALLPALLLPLACHTGPAPGSPEAAFAALEERLLGAERLEVEFEITSEGAVASEVRGMLQVHGEHVSLFGRGHLMERPLRVEMVSTEHELRGGHDVAKVLGPRPVALREGIVLGLTRMGLLHNIAVLHANRPPDGVDGEVRRWSRVGAFESDDDGGLRFELTVAGQSVGQAVLRLEEGLPATREQCVQFPQGEMRVRERYTRFVVR